MREQEIAQRLFEVEDLPTLPAVMTQLLEAIDEPYSNAEDITRIIEKDLALSAKILRLANSAFYGLRYKVDTIRRAVVVIGFEAVRMLALATSVFDSLSERSQFAFDPEEFWLHALGTAKAAQLLAPQSAPDGGIGAHFTAGLLHDMGKYCLALVLKKEYRDIVETAAREERMLNEVEQDVLGTTHPSAGAWVAEKWHLPLAITDAIAFQCNPQDYTGPHTAEVSIIALASDLARMSEYGDAGDFAPVVLGDARLAQLGMERESVDSVKDKLNDYYEGACQFLDALIQN